jgi:hypothetical protein
MIGGFMFLVIEFKLDMPKDHSLAQLFLELLCMYFSSPIIRIFVIKPTRSYCRNEQRPQLQEFACLRPFD